MKFIVINTLLVSILSTVPVYAMTSSTHAITNKDAEAQNQESIPQVSAREQVDSAIEEYFFKRGITPGILGKSGKIYYAATETVSASSANPDWAKSRVLAYEKALFKVQTQYIVDQFGKNSVEIVNKYSANKSTNADQFEERTNTSKIVALYDKIIALQGAKLDSLLEEAGVDPTEYSSLPPSEQKTLFHKSYIKKSLQKAMGKASGLLPIQTFEGNNSNGRHAIGVIMVRSDKLQQLASDMSSQREPFLSVSKGKPIQTYTSVPVEALAQTFGVRVVFDVSGKPVVLSYGQWGFGYNGKNDSRLDRDREHAAKKADSQAIDGLTIFMNSTIALERANEEGEIIEDILKKQGAEISEIPVEAIIDKTMESAKLKARARISGTSVIKRWSFKHPYGHEIVGRVRMWSMDGVNAAKSITSFNAQNHSQHGRKPNSSKTTRTQPAQVKSGIEFDIEESF